MDNHSVPAEQLEAIYAFIDVENEFAGREKRERMRRKLELTPDTVAVFGCGTRDWRKAPDLFVEVAEQLTASGIQDFRFFWIGAAIPGEYDDLEDGLERRGVREHVSFLGTQSNPRDFFCAGDIFLLSSREDPFPLVCLEAADAKMPTVCFADAGGMPDFVEDDGGIVVPHGDIRAMSEAVAGLVADRERRESLGRRARQKLLERHTVDIAMPEILHVIRQVSGTPPVVSVILPNYNYEHYIERRVDSILSQSFQDFELLIEDDHSTDRSVELLQRYAARRHVQLTAHPNNRGAFTMWLEGLKAASGELIWIAEADDLCEPDLLESLLPFFGDEAVSLAYAQSYVIDEHGKVQGDYSLCFPDLSPTKWLKSYTNTGQSEFQDGLAIKNTILNASAVVFRKPAVELMEEVLRDFKLSGDWYLYLNILQGTSIAYCADKLNYHRRHGGSIIAKYGDRAVAIAEMAQIHNFLIEHNDLETNVVQGMVDYAFETWKADNPDSPVREFWALYDLNIPASARSSMLG